MDEAKKGNLNTRDIAISVIIAVIIAVILNIAITMWANSGESLSDFKVESFNMETEKSNTLTSYTGEGVISCKNKDSDYIVLLEEKDKTKSEINHRTVVVHNGLGKFSTYDSNYSGTTEKPEYEFNIIGYRRFNKD